MKSLIILVLVSLFTSLASAKVEVVKAHEELKNFDIKDQIANAVFYGYYDFDSSPTEEDWDQAVSESKMMLVEKTLSSLPEDAEDYSPDKRITTIMKVVYAPQGMEDVCTIEVRKQFGFSAWKITPKGGIYNYKTPDYWNAKVLDCVQK